MTQRTTDRGKSYSDTFAADVDSDFGGAKSYEWLRDAVLHAFNPPDEDGAEEQLCEQAIFAAADFIAKQPCTCEWGWDPQAQDSEVATICDRCAVLGMAGGEVELR